MLYSESRKLLSELRKKLRSLKRRKFITEPEWNRKFDVDATLWQIDESIKHVDKGIKYLEKLEKQHKKHQARKKDTTNKTAGRNFLLPRLGR